MDAALAQSDISIIRQDRKTERTDRATLIAVAARAGDALAVCHYVSLQAAEAGQRISSRASCARSHARHLAGEVLVEDVVRSTDHATNRSAGQAV